MHGRDNRSKVGSRIRARMMCSCREVDVKYVHGRRKWDIRIYGYLAHFIGLGSQGAMHTTMALLLS